MCPGESFKCSYLLKENNANFNFKVGLGCRVDIAKMNLNI